MQVRISRLILSSVFNSLSHSLETCSSYSQSTRYKLLRPPSPRSFSRPSTTHHFSTVSNRPMAMRGAAKRDHQEGKQQLFRKFEIRDEDMAIFHEDPKPQNSKTKELTPDSSTEDAEEIFKKMTETGLIPNAVAMIDGLCEDGLIQEAMQLFRLMREKGMIPEVVIYTAVVDGFCKALKFEDAKRIFRKMQANGIVPNAYSYTVLIQGLCKGILLDDSVVYCLEMLEAGHSLNVDTFVNLIVGLCREKGIKKAETVIRELRNKGFAIDEKAVRKHVVKKGPLAPPVWEAIFGKKNTIQRGFAIDEKAVRKHLDKKGRVASPVWEAIIGKKNTTQRGFAIDEKAVRKHLDKKGRVAPPVKEANVGKKNTTQRDKLSSIFRTWNTTQRAF